MIFKRLTHPSLSLSCLALIIVVAAVAPLAAQAPVANWKFDEGSGTTVFDSSGNGHNGLLLNGVLWVNGARGWAVSASGANKGHVTMPAIDLSGTQAVTIAFWVKRNYTVTGGGALLEASENYQSSSTGFAFLPDDDTCHGIQAALRGNEGTTANCYAQPSSGVWHHLAIVYDKSQTGGNAVAFYVDGVLQAPNWNLFAATNTNNFGKNPIYLFSRSGRSQFSSGTISDFRVYNRALAAAQVQGIYNDPGSPSPPPELVAAYSFNEGSGSTVADASGNGNTGAISNATWTAAGKYGDALVFNGQNSLITVSDAASLHLTAMTLEAWVNPSEVSSAWRDVIYKGNDNYFLEVTSNPGGYPAGGATLGGSAVVTYGTADVPVNSWTHLAATYDGSTVRLYVNGALVSSQSHSGNIAPSSRPLQIGGDGILGQFFKGTIDEVRIYNTALTQSQIQSDMNTPIGAALVSISVTAASPSIVVTGQQQFTATGTYSDGSHQDLTNSVTWTSSLPSVASVGATGMAMGVAVGNTTLHASSGSIYGIGNLGVTPGGFTIVASPASLSIAQGSHGTSTITTMAMHGFLYQITLSATGAPTGTSVSFNPNPIPAGGILGNSTMTITVGSSTPTGTYPITVTGNGGGAQNSTTVTLTVTAPPTFTISASPASLSVVQGNQGTSTITTAISNGFNSSIRLSPSGVPSGTTVSFNPNPIPAPGSGNSTMSISVGSSTPTGTYPITVTGNGGGTQQSTTVTLTVTAPPTFTISASPASLSVVQGNQGTSTITTAISNGFNSSISLSASGVPSGTTVSFNPNPIPAPGSGSSTMSISVGSSTPTGTYPITVTGNGGGVQQSTTMTLTVTSAPTFTVSASPSSLTVMQETQGTSTITVTISNGFNNPVSLSASGVPSGTTVSFNPATLPAPGSGNSIMTITVGTTLMGANPITITATGGGTYQTTTVNLTVTAQVILTWTASQSPGIAGYNVYRSLTSGGPYAQINSNRLDNVFGDLARLPGAVV